MAFHLAAGLVAGALALAAFVTYVWSILKGETRPNRATWLILPISGVVLIAGSLSEGSGWTALIWPISFVAMQIVVFALSIRYGEGGFTRFDLTCLAGAGLGIALWVITDNVAAALVLNLLVDFAGIAPTIRKAALDPASESRASWTLDALAGIAELASISVWTLGAAVFPAYAAGTVILIAALLYRPLLTGREIATDASAP